MSSFVYYLAVCLSIAALSFVSAKYAEQTNRQGNELQQTSNASKVFAVGIMFNVLWTLMCVFSKDLLFDSALYDVLVTLFYYPSLLLMGLGVGLSLVNITGFALIIIGLICMKV
jgi:hypothetical protein